MGFWQRTKDWLSGARGRVRRLFSNLPSAEQIQAELEAWRDACAEGLARSGDIAETTIRVGDKIVAFEPQDTRIIETIRRGAQMLEFVAPVSGLGGDKERALLAKVREVGRAIEWGDTVTDAWWVAVGRPMLTRYAARCKQLNGWLVP